MLIQFSVRNYGSFRDDQTLSLVASAYDEMQQWVIKKDVPGLKGLDYLSAAGIFGSNASGKSMLIDAVATMRRIVRESAVMMPDERLPHDPFRLDDRSASGETAFEIVFEHGGVRYDYSFSYTSSRVTRESLRRFVTKSPQTLYSVTRKADGSFELSVTQRMAKLRKQEGYLRAKPNALLLSRGAQEGIQELVDPYTWISSDLLVYEAPFDHADQEIYGPVIEGALGEGMRSKLISLARKADLGIVDIRAKEVPGIPEERLKEFYTPEVVEQLLKTKTKTAVFVHQGTASDVEFSVADESVGTRSFLSSAAACLRALEDGKTLMFDEIDCSLHPKLAEALVELFSDEMWNTKGAQLVFTAHTVSIMDHLRRDQVWKASKGADGASTLDSLSDYYIRKDEKKSRGYAAGRYGGVPVVDFSMEGRSDG